MIVAELMQSSKVATVAYRVSSGIGNVFLASNLLFNSIIPLHGLCNAYYVVSLLASAPTQRGLHCFCSLIVASHPDFIQRSDIQGSLRETVLRHQGLMTAF